MNQIQTTSFNAIKITNHNGKQWFAATDISKALGYKRSDIISKLYRNNADEFSEGMVENTEVVVLGNLKKTVRLFSFRGAHLIAMFAKTDTAKQFRKWVLDLIEREAAMQQPALPHQDMTEAQKYELKNAIDTKVLDYCGGNKKIRAQVYKTIYTSLYHWFQVTSYCNIPSSRFQEALDWVLDYSFDGSQITHIANAPSIAPDYQDIIKTTVQKTCEYIANELDDVIEIESQLESSHRAILMLDRLKTVMKVKAKRISSNTNLLEAM